MASAYYSIGSKGDDVKKLQSALSNAGYNVGSSGADGIYGRDTQAAVSAYQKAKGLAVDGIAGVETLGSLYKPAVQIVPPITPAIPDKPLVNSGPTNLSSLKDVKVPYTDTAPLVYKSPYEDKMNSILDKYLDFDLNASVDPTKLPEYGALKQQYDDAGASAYNNQIGRLSAMTGGRPSTAAVGAASQSQNAYAKDFAGTVIPGLISNEQNRRQNAYDNLANQLKMLQGFDDISYGRGRDALSDTRYTDETSYNRGQDAIRNTGTMTVDDILASISADSPLRNIGDFSTAIANEKDPWVKAQLQALRMEKINADPELKAKYGSTMEIPTYRTQDSQDRDFDQKMAEAEFQLDTKYKNEQIANMRADNARQSAGTGSSKAVDVNKLGTPEQVGQYWQLRDIYLGGGSGLYSGKPYEAYSQLIGYRKQNVEEMGDRLYDQLVGELEQVMKNQKSYSGESADASANASNSLYNSVYNEMYKMYQEGSSDEEIIAKLKAKKGLSPQDMADIANNILGEG